MTNSAGWVEVPVRDVGEALVAAMGEAGIEYVFFTSGSEICFYQEAIAKSEAIGRRAPKLITVPHEHAGLNAALGYAAIAGKPAVTAVHVDAGTLHQGAAIHTAMRSGLPVLMTAGGPPTAYPGSMAGARAVAGHIWMQQTFDQHGAVRQYVKWDHRLEYQDNPGLILSRALQVACTEPAGPTYLSLPSEVMVRQIESASFPSLAQMGIARAPAPDPAGIREIVSRLLAARNPALVMSRSGRDLATVPALAELCETLGLPVVDATSRGYQCFPLDHPLYQGSLDLSEADFVLVLEADVPWMPGAQAPGRDCYIAMIDIDPAHKDIPTLEFCADLRLSAGSMSAIRALKQAADEMMTDSDRASAAERLGRWSEASRARRQSLDEAAEEARHRQPIASLWLASRIGRLLGENAILFDDSLPHHKIDQFVRCARPGSYYANCGTSGGWAPGAAFGAKLAAPERDVIAVTGDGFYMFGTPEAALWCARRYQAPYLTIVLQNRSYNTGTLRLDRAYPQGYGRRPEFDYEGGYLEPAIDFALAAQSAGAYGENVRDPKALEQALQRGLAETRAGRPAVIAVWMARQMKDS